MASPQTANFGPEATQLSAPQGAGANPVQGVQEPASGIDLSPISTLIQGADSMFTDMLKKKKDQGENQIINEFVTELTKNDQMRLQTGDRSKWMAQQQIIYNKYAGTHGDLVDKLQKVVNFRKGGLVEEQETEAQSEQKRRNAVLDKVSTWANTNVSTETQDFLIDAQRTSDRLAQQQEEIRQSEKHRASMDAAEREAYDSRVRREGVRLVNDIAIKHEQSFSSYMFDLARQVKDGRIDEIEANRMAGQYFSNIQMILSSASTANPQLAAPFKASFESMYNNGREFFKPGAKLKDLEDQVKKIRLQGQLKFMTSDPDLPELAAASEIFKNHPDILLSLDPKIVKVMGAMGVQETGATSPVISSATKEQIVGIPKYEKPAFDALKAAIKQSVDGAGGDRKKLNTEVYGQMKGLFSQYSDQYLLQRLTPESRKNMNEFLMDKTVAKFMRDNPVPVSVAQTLTRVVQDNFKQYKSTVTNALSDVLPGQVIDQTKRATLPDGSTVSSPSLSGLGSPISKPRTPDVDPLDAIDISWQGDRMVFTPKKMPVDTAQQALLVSRLNQLSNVLSNGVIIGAHIEGSTDYGAYFNKSKHIMFEGKFPVPYQPKTETKKAPPAPPGVKRSKEEEAMAGDVAEVFTPSAPDGNEGIRTQYNLDSIRKELKKHKKGSPEYNILMEEFARNVEGM
jgi:hypothetical protein